MVLHDDAIEEDVTDSTQKYKESDFEAYPPYNEPMHIKAISEGTTTTDLPSVDRVVLIAHAIFYAICIGLFIGLIMLIVIGIYMIWKLYTDSDD